MCGRYTSSTPASNLAEYFGVDEIVAPDLGARYNVAPTDETYAVAESSEGRRLGTFRWGLVPFWAKDLKVGAKMINARAEGLLDSNAFRRSFERRRCIIPADGFYEWQKRPGQKHKQPFFIHRPDGEPYAFAGLWETWKGPDGKSDEVLRSCTIITTTPNDEMAKIHDRMPVILPPEAWDTWLDRDNEDLELLGKLLVPAPPHLIVLRPISTAVNNVRNNSADLMDEVAPMPDAPCDPE
jgi:putative SOS response-associated peptidase YedK